MTTVAQLTAVARATACWSERVDYESFMRSLADRAPPLEANIAMRALWYDANDAADSAMRAAMSDESHMCLRVRAYLCRKSGAEQETRRWYWRCGIDPWTAPLEAEWEDILRNILVEVVVERAYQ